ncbi:hypothetical protein [Paraburkholderia haematera]|uniref:hypothetical protein n=1 Tax=Paraburkholderia haematera TaxID=2793077 RepID=UPI0038B3789C
MYSKGRASPSGVDVYAIIVLEEHAKITHNETSRRTHGRACWNLAVPIRFRVVCALVHRLLAARFSIRRQFAAQAHPEFRARGFNGFGVVRLPFLSCGHRYTFAR